MAHGITAIASVSNSFYRGVDRPEVAVCASGTNRWEGLARFVHDKRICMTNYAAERALRGFAPGRSPGSSLVPIEEPIGPREEEDWLWDIANGIDPEDGLIWVFGVRDNGVMARSPTSASSP